MRDIAQKEDLQIIGSYNPYRLNLKDEDFYDTVHLRGVEKLKEIFLILNSQSREERSWEKSKRF